MPLMKEYSPGPLHHYLFFHLSLCRCCSVVQSGRTLQPQECSIPGFPVFHHLKFMPIESMMLSNHLILCWCLLLLCSIFSKIRVSPLSWLFTSGGKSIGASASTSVLPVNIQCWFPLGLTGFISLQCKGLSRVFTSTTIQKHRFFGTHPSSWFNSHIHTRPLEKPLPNGKSTTGLPWWLSGKESTWNAEDTGDLGSIPGSGRSTGRGHGNPL